MRTTLLLALAALLFAACNDDSNDEAKHAYVTCGASWAANGPTDLNITKCEAACQNYIDDMNSDTCDGTKWNHTLQEPNTMPDGIAGLRRRRRDRRDPRLLSRRDDRDRLRRVRRRDVRRAAGVYVVRP